MAIEIGGEGVDAMSVRGVVAGRVVCTTYLDDPPARVITGTGGTMTMGESTNIRLECILSDNRLVVLAEASP